MQVEKSVSQIEDQQEIDIWWGAYAGRAMLPHFGVCAAATLLVAVIAWQFWELNPIHPQIKMHGTMFIIMALWFVPLLRWLHRSLAWNYRLTSQRLYQDRGFHPSRKGIELVWVKSVQVQQQKWERWLGIGHIVLYVHGATTPMRLDGVREPMGIARMIENAVHDALLTRKQ